MCSNSNQHITVKLLQVILSQNKLGTYEERDSTVV